MCCSKNSREAGTVLDLFIYFFFSYIKTMLDIFGHKFSKTVAVGLEQLLKNMSMVSVMLPRIFYNFIYRSNWIFWYVSGSMKTSRTLVSVPAMMSISFVEYLDRPTRSLCSSLLDSDVLKWISWLVTGSGLTSLVGEFQEAAALLASWLYRRQMNKKVANVSREVYKLTLSNLKMSVAECKLTNFESFEGLSSEMRCSLREVVHHAGVAAMEGIKVNKEGDNMVKKNEALNEEMQNPNFSPWQSVPATAESFYLFGF